MSRSGKRVKVWVRTRPTANFAHDMLDLQSDGKTINIHCRRDTKRGVVNNQILDWSFRLDGILHNASQEAVAETVGSSIVTSALNGYNGTIMCYGQTGAGKTFTMTGATENYKHRGIIPRSLSQLFREIDERTDHAVNVRVSYLEIYNETMFDLLSTLPDTPGGISPSSMAVVEDEHGVYVKGLSCHLAQNEEEALNLLFEGETNRAIAEHSLNKQSSRSHCIFTVYIESRSRVQSEARYTMSKLNFVDLAGSERLGKTRSEGRTQQEAMYINKSLTFLEQTVIALADKRREHIPFRQTKLTHCLKDSIGGNCNTLLIANIWGESAQIEESISTLRFATRMMCIAQEPAVNEEYDPAIMVKKLEREIRALKNELSMHDTLTNRSQITYEPLSEQQRYEIRQQVQQYAEGSLDEIDIINVRQIQGVYEAFKELCLQMEKDIEDRLRARYTMIDKSDPAAIAAAQQAGIAINDDGELVGEPDGTGYSVGPAPTSIRPAPSSVVNARKKDARRGRQKDRTSPAPNATSPVQSGKGGPTDASSATPSGHREERDDAGTPSSAAGTAARPSQSQRPSTPPSRTDAFEEFKQEMGSEINRILLENKDIHGAKKMTYGDKARQINLTKLEIDKSRARLEFLKQDRESQGVHLNEEGDIIISEDEFLEIKRLKDLKANYRRDFDDLKQLKSEVQYCDKLVSQCRQRLIQEFDNWYAESFLAGAEGDQQANGDLGHGPRSGAYQPAKLHDPMLEDEQEKFDRLQMSLLMENPDSAAFYNAKMRTERRKTYEAAMSQPQPTMRRKVGTPTRNMRQQPPTMLQVQY